MNLNDLFTEEKVRLDPKCWTGKKIGNPKTKMKGGVRVNNCVPAESINEFAPANNPSGGNYLKALASAWYNGTFNTGNLHKGIKSQEDVERILERGIHCGDGKIRKYSIGYNAEFDGVEIQSDDHYEYSDYDDAGNDIDSRTGKPWGPYDVVEFGDNDLDESIAETALQDKEDLDAKRRALQDLEREPGHDQEAIRQRKLDLEKEARAKGMAGDQINEKSTSQAQFRTMAAAAHNPEFARKVGIKQSVAKEFNQADKGQDYKDLPKKADEGKSAPKEKEADYGDDYQAMVSRLKQLAGAGPLKTVYDPKKRVYKNIPTAVQPKR
jgi:hypothetical protein